MSRFFKVTFFLIMVLGINIGISNTLWATENKTEIKENVIDERNKREIKEILKHLLETLEEKKYSDYLYLFHSDSPIYSLNYTELKETIDSLSYYGLVYELESIKFLEKTGKDIKAEVNILAKATKNENYIDRRNTFEYTFRKKGNKYKIYDMVIRNIEALDRKDKTNEVLDKKRLYHGDGTLAYEGSMKDGIPHGEGDRYYKNGEIMYKGTFKNGKMSGKGVFYDEKGRKVYEGEVEDGCPDGEGVAYYPNGGVFYIGHWKNGTFNRRGKIYYENGRTMYMGELVEGRANGKGRGYYESGRLWYNGDMKDDFSHGTGIEYYETGEKMYEGEFDKGNFHGEGIKYDKDGNIIYKGTWENGEPK
ncbi:MAG: hypothetical protein GX308_04080 [Epulopiscium sp.]|nr:hypothetical protein [Candidatus Epulonipiscium sp.]